MGDNDSGVYLIKTDEEGNEIWIKFFQGLLYPKIKETQEGGYIIVGNRYNNSISYRKIVLLKINREGELEWEKDLKAWISTFANSFTVTSDNEYLIGGWTKAHSDDYPRAYLVKANSFGEKIWEKIIPPDYFTQVSETEDNNYLVGGVFIAGIAQGGNWTVFQKFDKNGNLIWGTSHLGDPQFVLETIEGNYLLGVYQRGAWWHQVYLAKYNKEGKKLWDLKLENLANALILQTKDGNYFVLGNPYKYSKSLSLLNLTSDIQIQKKDFEVYFDYNLDKDLNNFEGRGKAKGTILNFEDKMKIEGEVSFEGPLPTTPPNIYLIATDGLKKELSSTTISFSSVKYSQIGEATYFFSVLISNPPKPKNDGHYELFLEINGKPFFINTNSRINKNYLPLINLPEKIEENKPPIPIINFSPKNPVKGVKVKFDASSSKDFDGEIKELFWEIKRKEEILATSTATTATFAFPENGEYQITLIATDNDGATSSTSTTIKVEPFSFAIITDLHIGRGYPDYDGEGFDDGYNGEEYYLTQRLRNVVNWIIQNKDNIHCDNATCSLKFLVVLGDIADSGEKSEFLKAKEILDELNNHGIPYVPVFGNHDVWPKTDLGDRAKSPLGVNYFEEVFFDENATNTKLLKEKLNLTKEDFQYKNYLFKFGGVNFIVLDFITRKDIGKATLHEQTMDWLKKKLNEFQGKEPIILFSHHPLTPERSREFHEIEIIPFPGTNFGKKDIQYLSNIFEDYENLSEGKQILGAFGGHVHGYYPQEILDFKFPHLQWFFDANYEYPSIGPTSAVTTEALMVGSNRENEYLKENNKGIVRIVKVLDKEKVNYQTIEGRYDPDTEKGKEFIALNPYLSFEYKILSERIYPCVFFRAHLFTKRDTSVIWDFGDNKTGVLDVIVHCYDKPGIYEVKLSVIDNKTLIEEYITRKIEIKKEGIIPKIIKISKKMREKIELISTELGEKVTEFGRTMQDWIIAKVKHSSSTPVGLFKVHFEKAKEDIDLSQLRIEVDLEKRKSLFYMPQWPEEIEKEKILFVPK